MNIAAISELVITIAKEQILPRFRKLATKDITAKSPGDMVSVADTETENILAGELNSLCPAALVGGEEMIARNPQIMDKIIAADRAFLIDPIDGTNNFIRGDQKFALMLTYLYHGKVASAWIYLPFFDKIAVAETGGGACLNGEKITVSAGKFVASEMTGAAHINRFPDHIKKMARKNMKNFAANHPAFCAGYDYIALLEGRKDFSVYYRTLPWDHLPGSFIYTEAGGYVRTLHKQRYTIHDQDKGLLSARNAEHWQQIHDIIFPAA